jgi:hypothetical protein
MIFPRCFDRGMQIAKGEVTNEVGCERCKCRGVLGGWLIKKDSFIMWRGEPRRIINVPSIRLSTPSAPAGRWAPLAAAHALGWQCTTRHWQRLHRHSQESGPRHFLCWNTPTFACVQGLLAGNISRSDASGRASTLLWMTEYARGEIFGIAIALDRLTSFIIPDDACVTYESSVCARL